MNINFAQRLKGLREMSGLTQSELALKIGCDPSAIARFEAGRREPNLENLTKLVKALGVAADVLLGTARP